MTSMVSALQRVVFVFTAAASFVVGGCRPDSTAPTATSMSDKPAPITVGTAQIDQCVEPSVKPDEACYYAKPCYQDLIRCVSAGESYKAENAVVRSVVLGSRVLHANTSSCQFYGPEVAYSQAVDGCSTDRLWTDTTASTPDT